MTDTNKQQDQKSAVKSAAAGELKDTTSTR